MRSIDLVRSTKPGGKCGTRSSAFGMYIKYCFFPSTATKEIKRKKERKKERTVPDHLSYTIVEASREDS